MGFDRSEMNFNPSQAEDQMDVLFASIAEHAIVRTIFEGSGGPDNEEITEPGLRFIRYLLSISRAARFGFLPNFKDHFSACEIARQFIQYCGSPTVALSTMNRVAEQGMV